MLIDTYVDIAARVSIFGSVAFDLRPELAEQIINPPILIGPYQEPL
jgi:hypothetical protein